MTRIEVNVEQITARVRYALDIPREPADWSEEDLLAATIKLAWDWRWACCHFRPARTRKGYRTPIQGHKGFPDLVLAKGGVLLLRELKGPKGRVQGEQLDWGQQIQPEWSERLTRDIAARCEPRLAFEYRSQLRFDVWRPVDWEPLIIPTLTASRVRSAA